MIQEILNNSFRFISSICNEPINITTKISGLCSSGSAVASTGTNYTQLIVTILLAFVAGSVALRQAKFNVISTARIRRIEEFRDVVSKLCSAANGIFLGFKNYDKSKEEKYYYDYQGHLSEYYILSNKLKLHLNMNNYNHQQMNTALEQLRVILGDDKLGQTTFVEISASLEIIVINSNAFLKKEWIKSKKFF
jgi:hypothetical protein